MKCKYKLKVEKLYELLKTNISKTIFHYLLLCLASSQMKGNLLSCTNVRNVNK